MLLAYLDNNDDDDDSTREKWKDRLSMYIFIQPLWHEQDVTQGQFLSEIHLHLI